MLMSSQLLKLYWNPEIGSQSPSKYPCTNISSTEPQQAAAACVLKGQIQRELGRFCSSGAQNLFD